MENLVYIYINVICKHGCQSMTLAHLTFKNRNNTFIFRIHPEDRFFNFYTLHYNNFFLTACTIKTSILLLYNLSMRYRLSLLLTQSRFSHYLDLIISARLNFWFRVKIHGLATHELGAKHYRVS